MNLFFRIALSVLLALTASLSFAQSDYKIRTNDVLTIEVLEDPTLNRSVQVLPDGKISFPRVGTLRVRGRTVDQVTNAITAAIETDFASQPNVFVSIAPAEIERTVRTPAPPPTINIYFLGEVNAPGLKEMEPGVTFLQALSQSGGLTRFAADKRIQLRRTDARTNQQRVIKINYRALSRGASLSRDITLRDGDVILVPERRLFE